MSMSQLLNRTLIVAIALLTGPLALAATINVNKAEDANDGSCDADCSPRQEVVFIDGAVSDREAVLRALDPGDASRSLEVIWLDPAFDGVAQVSTALAMRTDIDAVHILSHGQEGGITIGTTFVDESEARRHATEIEGWRESLRPGADLLVYGCRSARGTDGERFLQTLAELTGADVAGSEYLVGNSQSGGEWLLGVRVGQIETREAVSAAGREAWPGLLAVLGYDSFSYPTGALDTRSGGTGWSDAWAFAGTGSIDVVAAGLTHPGGGLATAGGAVQLNAGVLLPAQTVRNLSSSFGAATETIWASFLVTPQNTGAVSYLGITLGNALANPGIPDVNRLFVGYKGTNFNMNSWGGFSDVNVPGVVAGQTAFLVVRLDINAGAGLEVATLYVNPTAGLAAPDVTGTAKSDLDLGTFTSISIGGGRGFAANPAQIDEIRIGNTYADVAPPTVPVIEANLALTKADSADPVSMGNALTYNLTVTNNGPDDATNVTLVDTLPADVDWQSATPSQGSCVHSGELLGGTVTCTLGTITNGANTTVTIDVVAPNTTGVINNSATVSADEPDPDASDNTATEETTVIDPSANLSVTQAEDLDPAGVNLPFVYTVTVTNPGPADATLVTLVDTLDAAVAFQTAVPSQGICAEAGGTVTCDLGDLNSGSIATIDITVIAPATPQIVTSTAVVSAAEPDSDLSDNTWAEDTDVIDPPPADLELTMTDAPDPVVEGTPLTYTLTINNLGPGPATMVQLTDTLPAGVAFVSATLSSSGSCSESLGVVDCSFDGAINNGASETVTIVVTAPATAGSITNNASVSTARVDPITANDSASVDTIVTIADEADLSLSKSDSPDPVNVNQALSYSLTIDNLGPDDATDVVLVDTLPAAVTFQSAISSQGSCSESGGTVTCNLGIIANAANATVDIIVIAPPSAGSITNNASVSASTDDFDPANDSASETTTVQNLNVNQLCYLVADAGGGGGGNDRLTQIDTADFDPLTNETNIGIGTGTNRIEAIAWNSATGVLYAADSGRLGTLSTTTGVFTALPSSFGTGSGASGNITFNDVDGLTYDATTRTLYGSERQSGTDVLIQIDMATGAHVPNAFGAGIDYVPMPPISGNSLTDDIAVDPTTGIMYAAVNSGGSTDRLIIVDKDTGATTDVAEITVPDIEGLGTDPTGQLWGTSGTQGILYELDKATGIGSNGRTIDNGSDYESVDCYAFSPSVIADLAVTKIVDDAAPAEGANATYTVTATNTGPGIATVVQLSDVLPAGVTFASAIVSQGTYNSIDGRVVRRHSQCRE